MDGGMLGKPCKWSRNPNVPGGVREGYEVVVVRVGGSGKVIDFEKDLTVTEKVEETWLERQDIFSPEFGSEPENYLNPLLPSR
jgi:hypothetical protein